MESSLKVDTRDCNKSLALISVIQGEIHTNCIRQGNVKLSLSGKGNMHLPLSCVLLWRSNCLLKRPSKKSLFWTGSRE